MQEAIAEGCLNEWLSVRPPRQAVPATPPKEGNKCKLALTVNLASPRHTPYNSTFAIQCQIHHELIPNT